MRSGFAAFTTGTDMGVDLLDLKALSDGRS